MTTGVLDVEAVESGVEGAIDAREIQQKIEGRLEMTLDELAQLHSYIDGRAR
jgi:archaellum component FlaC